MLPWRTVSALQFGGCGVRRYSRVGADVIAHKRKRRRDAGVFVFWLKAADLLDQHVRVFLAGFERGIEPARALAAAGPGFRRVGRIEELRRNLAARTAGLATGAEDVFEGIALGLDQVVDLFAQLDDLVLANVLLAGLRLVDEVVELLLVELADVNGHGHLLICRYVFERFGARQHSVKLDIMQCSRLLQY